MKKVSFITGSRGRYDLMVESIASLKDKEGNWDIHIAIDPDEEAMNDYLALNDKKIHVYVMPERYGYRQLHKYYNAMAAKSDGDWIFNWNDDAQMITEDWFDKIVAHDHTIAQVLSPYHPQDNLFPVISRRWYEVLKHYSLSPHVDSWVQQIGEWTGSQVFVPDFEIHHNGTAMKDPTYLEGREDIRFSAPEFSGEIMTALRHADADKIKEDRDGIR